MEDDVRLVVALTKSLAVEATAHIAEVAATVFGT